MIREAKIEEIPEFANFMKQFEKETQFVKVDVEHTTKVYQNLMSRGEGTIFIMVGENGKYHGGIGCLKGPGLHDGTLTAVETFFYVHPDHRGLGMGLLRAFEKWAKQNRCKKMAIVHLADSYPEVLKKVYEHRGYKLLENHFVKEN